MSGGWIALIVALWLMVIALAVLVLGLINRVGRLERAASTQAGLADPEVRAPARGPQLGMRLPVVSGHERLVTPSASAKRLILFLSSSCGPCKRLAADLKAAVGIGDGEDAATPAGVELVVVTDRAGVELFGDLAASELVAQSEGELSSAWNVPGTPFAIALDDHDVVRASGFASKLTHLNDLAGVLRDPSPVG
jgi:hypothetical protein